MLRGKTRLPVKTEDQYEHGHAGRKRPAEVEDSRSRLSWRTKNMSAYREILGDSPQLKPDDRTGSRAMLAKIDECLERGGWTRAENRRLHQLRNKWQRRADGSDARFRVVGTYQGGLTPAQQEQVKAIETFMRHVRVDGLDKELTSNRAIDGGDDGVRRRSIRGGEASNTNAAGRSKSASSKYYGWGRD